MYLPLHFATDDRDALRSVIRQHALATLVLATDDGDLAGDHVPLLLLDDGSEHGVLQGHVARANPLWSRAAAGCPALAVFLGAEAYVSPSWYPSKAQHGKVVPTWNYVAVHATGVLRAVDDAVWLRALLDRLTDVNEAGRAHPWKVGDAPAPFVAASLQAIVGIELRITGLVGKRKLSQNRSPADVDGVVRGLRDERKPVAEAMARLVAAPDGGD